MLMSRNNDKLSKSSGQT